MEVLVNVFSVGKNIYDVMVEAFEDGKLVFVRNGSSYSEEQIYFLIKELEEKFSLVVNYNI